MVLVVLALIWGVVLVPPALRLRAERRTGASVDAFDRQLGVLRRTGPHASRSVAAEWGRSRSYGTRGPAPVTSVTSLAARRAQATQRAVGRPSRAVGMTHAGMSLARRRTLRRRRDVFTALLGMAAVSLLLGLVPAFRVLLLVHLAVDVLLVAYVAMLIRQRTLAAEREMKVRFLPESRPMEPALLRRSVN